MTQENQSQNPPQNETPPKAGAIIVPVTLFEQNCTIIWHEPSKKAVVIDPGGDVPKILEAIKQTGVTVDREKDELCAGALCQELPRHDVAVVLHLGEQDFVAALDELGAPRCGDEVDALGSTAGEDDFVGAAGVEEFRSTDAGRFERVGRAFA